MRSHRSSNKWKNGTSSLTKSRHPSYRPTNEMMRENACSVVYGDGIHWAQDYTDYGYGNGGRDEGRYEPNYQLKTLFFYDDEY